MSNALSIPNQRQYYGAMAGIREFGDLIKNARVNQGITGTDLASRMERSHSQIVRWENGAPSNPPDIDIFWEFSEALGLPPEQMLEALGYLKPDSDKPRENEAIASARAIIGNRNYTEKQLEKFQQFLTTLVSMIDDMEG